MSRGFGSPVFSFDIAGVLFFALFSEQLLRNILTAMRFTRSFHPPKVLFFRDLLNETKAVRLDQFKDKVSVTTACQFRKLFIYIILRAANDNNEP